MVVPDARSGEAAGIGFGTRPISKQRKVRTMTKYDLWVDTDTGTYGGGSITLLEWDALPLAVRSDLDAAVESGDEAVIVRIANGYGWSA